MAGIGEAEAGAEAEAEADAPAAALLRGISGREGRSLMRSDGREWIAAAWPECGWASICAAGKQRAASSQLAAIPLFAVLCGRFRFFDGARCGMRSLRGAQSSVSDEEQGVESARRSKGGATSSARTARSEAAAASSCCAEVGSINAETIARLRCGGR